MQKIVSLRYLAARLGIPVKRLRAIARNIDAHYTEWPLLDEKKQKVRLLRIPSNELKHVQRRIKTNILDQFSRSEAAHGGIRGRSPGSNAKQHLGQSCVVNIDVRDFFPSVRHYVVYRMLRREGFGRDVAWLLTRLTTLNSQLPQGTSTSSGLADAVLVNPVDGPLALQAQLAGARYTRFIDDITISGADPRQLINLVGRLLSRARLRMHRPKRKWVSKPKFSISSRSQPQEITGLLVNSKAAPSISRKRRDDVRAAVFGLLKIPDEPTFNRALRSIRGRINHIREFNPGSARRLDQQLVAIIARRGSLPPSIASFKTQELAWGSDAHLQSQ